MSAEDRKASIMRQAIPLFAEHGFNGVKTKQIAKKAGISEALLYQHFPSKEALFDAVQDFYCTPDQDSLDLPIAPIEPGLAGLIRFVSEMVFSCIFGNKDMSHLLPRLMMQSMMEDGVFARQFVDKRVTPMLPVFLSCVKKAREDGDLSGIATPDWLCFWFPHHIAAVIYHHLRPETPVVDYKLTPEELFEHVVIFSLQGIGVHPDRITQHFNGKEFLDAMSSPKKI